MRRLVIFLLRCYQAVLSPITGNHCRFYPSCSSYALQAIEQHGLPRGGWLALRRVAKCHPWHEGGLDPVPPCPHSH
jgi:putative membrane protein insertion efficiency factor